MGMMIIRKIPDEVHNALKARAKRHHRSTEAEVRAILEEVTLPKKHLKMGDALGALGRELGLADEDIEAFQQTLNKTPAEPMKFE